MQWNQITSRQTWFSWGKKKVENVPTHRRQGVMTADDVELSATQTTRGRQSFSPVRIPEGLLYTAALVIASSHFQEWSWASELLWLENKCRSFSKTASNREICPAFAKQNEVFRTYSCAHRTLENLWFVPKHHLIRLCLTLFTLTRSNPRGIVLSGQNDTSHIHLKPDKRIPAGIWTNRLRGGRNSPYSGKAGVWSLGYQCAAAAREWCTLVSVGAWYHPTLISYSCNFNRRT